MPRWKFHRIFASALQLDNSKAVSIDYLLDFLGNTYIPHRLARSVTHNVPTAIAIGSQFGAKGIIYALMHILLDRYGGRNKRRPALGFF